MRELFIFVFFLFFIPAQSQEPATEQVVERIKEMTQDEQLNLLKNDFEVFRSKNHLNSEDYEKSLELYNVAIILNPDNEVMFGLRGNFYLRFREFDKAISDYSRSIELTKTDSIKIKLYTTRGVAKSNKRDFIGAYYDLQKAYNIDSTYVAALINLGAVAVEMGNKDESIFYLKKAIQIDSTCYPAYGNLGFQYQELGEYQEAIKYYNKVLELVPNDPLGFSNRAFNKMKLDNLDGALDDINKSISIYPENSYAYMVRALILIKKKDFEKACLDFSQSLEEGFTSMYGDRVDKLKEKYCSN